MAFPYPEFEGLPASAEHARDIDFSDHPRIAALNRICAQLMIVVGPMLCAALIVLFIWSEFFTN